MSDFVYNASSADLIDHEEVYPSPIEKYVEGGFEATRTLRVAWPNRHLLAQQLMGYLIGQSQAPSGTNPVIIVGVPHAYPHFDAALCRDVSIRPEGKSEAFNGDTKVMGYSSSLQDAHALLTVTYRTPGPGDPPAAEQGETVFTERLEPSAEFLTMPAKGLKWSDGVALEVEEAPGRIVRMIDYVVTVHQTPFLPAGWDLTDVTNAQPVYSISLDRTFAPETLLFAGCQPERIYTSKGAQAWTYTLRMQFRKDGWNRFFRAGFADPQEILTDQGPFKPYQPVAFDFLP